MNGFVRPLSVSRRWRGPVRRVDAPRTRWRRCRLLRAYMLVVHRRRVGEGGTSVRGGFVNHLIAIDQLERDGLVTFDGDGSVEWQWP